MADDPDEDSIEPIEPPSGGRHIQLVAISQEKYEQIPDPSVYPDAALVIPEEG